MWIYFLGLILMLGLLDACFVNHAYYSTLMKGASVQLVFGFEVCGFYVFDHHIIFSTSLLQEVLFLQQLELNRSVPTLKVDSLIFALSSKCPYILDIPCV